MSTCKDCSGYLPCPLPPWPSPSLSPFLRPSHAPPRSSLSPSLLSPAPPPNKGLGRGAHRPARRRARRLRADRGARIRGGAGRPESTPCGCLPCLSLSPSVPAQSSASPRTRGRAHGPARGPCTAVHGPCTAVHGPCTAVHGPVHAHAWTSACTCMDQRMHMDQVCLHLDKHNGNSPRSLAALLEETGDRSVRKASNLHTRRAGPLSLSLSLSFSLSLSVSVSLSSLSLPPSIFLSIFLSISLSLSPYHFPCVSFSLSFSLALSRLLAHSLALTDAHHSPAILPPFLSFLSIYGSTLPTVPCSSMPT